MEAEGSKQQQIAGELSVAIVEDDSAVADALAATIHENGWAASIYGTAESFIATLNAENSPDCIILDLHLPGMSGVDVLHELSQRNKAIPAIVLTAHPDGPLTNQAVEAGVVGLYTKPISSEVLIGSIKQATGSLSETDGR